MGKFSVSTLALADLQEIFRYLGENDSSKAIEFVRTMMKKFDLVANNPKMGVAKDAYIFGLRLFPFKNYNIFYFQTDDGVEIYRVLHSSRDTVQVFNDAIDEL